jgi:hypothetical protein
MRKVLVVLALLLCLPMFGSGQSINYYPAGGLSELTSSGTALTSTVPIKLPDGATGSVALQSDTKATTGLYFGSTDSAVILQSTAPYGIQMVSNGSSAGFEVVAGNYASPVANDTLQLGQATAAFTNAYILRSVQGSKSKALVDNTATAFVRLAVADDDYEACGLIWTAYAEDSDTDARQVRTGRTMVAILNNSGTESAVFSTGDEAVNVTAGTMTCTFDAAGGTNTIDLRATCNTSLDAAAETLTFEYRLDCPSTVTVTPQ